MTTSLELWVLAAVNTFENPHALTICAALRNISDKTITLGTIYRALYRLEDRGYVTSWLSMPASESGLYARRNYRIQIAGRIVLKEAVTSGVPLLETILASGGTA